MKDIIEIEKIANIYCVEKSNIGESHDFMSYVDGYNQCQEDMTKDVEYWQGEFDHWHQQAMEMADKKYTEEDMKKCWDACLDFNKPSGLDSGINYKDFINSLNKQD